MQYAASSLPHSLNQYRACGASSPRSCYGTYLLAIAHERLDSDRIPALHIIATTHTRDGLLQRHGYLPRRNPHPLPDPGPALWPLWRCPASAPRA